MRRHHVSQIHSQAGDGTSANAISRDAALSLCPPKTWLRASRIGCRATWTSRGGVAERGSSVVTLTLYREPSVLGVQRRRNVSLDSGVSEGTSEVTSTRCGSRNSFARPAVEPGHEAEGDAKQQDGRRGEGRRHPPLRVRLGNGCGVRRLPELIGYWPRFGACGIRRHTIDEHPPFGRGQFNVS
jgi:hypothetical protein